MNNMNDNDNGSKPPVPQGIPSPILCKALGIPYWALQLARRAAALPPGQHDIRLSVPGRRGPRQIRVNGGTAEILRDHRHRRPTVSLPPKLRQ